MTLKSSESVPPYVQIAAARVAEAKVLSGGIQGATLVSDPIVQGSNICTPVLYFYKKGLPFAGLILLP